MIVSKNSYLHLALLVSLVYYPVYSQNVIINETEVKHLEIVLTNNTVTTIYQDQTGFIWFGTYNGLNRFDGVNVKKFYPDPNKKNTLSDNYIQDICGDSYGNIWNPIRWD